MPPVDLRKLAASAAARMAKKLIEAGDHAGASAVGSAMGHLGNAPRLVKNISKGGEEAMVDLMVGQSRLAGPGAPGGLFARKLYKPDSLITRGSDTSALLAEKKRLTDAARNLSPEARSLTPAMHGHQELHSGTPLLRHVSDHEFVPDLQKIPRSEALQTTHQIQQQVVQPLQAKGLQMADLPKVEPGGAVSGNASNVMRGPDGQPRILDFLPQGGSSPVQMEGHVVRSPYLSKEMDPGLALKPGGIPFSSSSATPNQLRREIFQPTTAFRQKTLTPRPSATPPLSSGNTAVTSVEGSTPVTKVAELKTELLPHQKRVVERMKEPDRRGLVVIHGLGSGKCVRGSTPIYTDKGLLPIRDLFVEPWPDAGERVLPPGDVQVLSLVDSELRWCSLRARYIQKLPEEEVTRVVVTGRGNRVEVTAAHPLLKLVGGTPVWTPAADVKEGDWLVFPSTLPSPPSPREADLSLVHFLCWLAAEGWECPGKPGTGTITQKDESVLLPLQQYVRQKTASVANIHRKEGRASWLSFSSKSLGQDLASEGYTWGNLSKDKQLPAWLLACSDVVIDLALAALWSAEGSVSSACAEMTLASPVLLDQVKYLLLRRGGRSSLRSKEAMATNGHRIKRTYWRTHVSGADLDALVLEDLSAEKRSRLDELVNKTRNPNTGVPCGWLYELLRPAGVVPKMLGVSPNKSRSFSLDTAHKVCERLRSWSAEGAVEAQSRVVKSSGGPTRMYAERLLRVMQHPVLLRDALKKLEYLTSAPFRFEEVELIADGERGGYVFDVEVDSDVYDHKNWVGGSGCWFLHNTLTSIATQDALGTPATVVVPAALQENYRKEQAKHLKGKPEKTHIETLQRVALEGGAHPSPLTIFDEAHRLRDHTSASFQAAKQPGTDKRLLLTGSPFYNDPSDIAPLVNLAANRKVLPMGKEEFGSRYVGLKKVSPGFIQEHFMGIQPGEVPVLNERRADELRQIFAEHTDFHPGSTENFPRVDRRDVVVPMSKEQKEVYDTLMGQAPSWVAKKVKAGLPPSKQEMQSMGAFLTAPRQAVNSTSPYVKDEAAAQSPKIQKAFENLQALMKENPNAKAVIYSNFLDAGINPYKKLLEGAGIAHGEFTGSQNAKARDQMVKDYNEGKLKALLLSSAGGEGLDLKGTRLVQMLEPHWNEEKLKQVEGRAARYGSHSHLTPEEQQVLVERYLSGIEPGIVQKIKSKLFGSKPDQSVDQYLAMMSKDKENLNKQFRDLLPRHEKQAEEEPSALRSHLLHGLGYALPIQASFGALPLALRLQGVPHSGKFLAASQLAAAPISYVSMRGHGERQEAEAKRRAKVVAKNARKMPELEEDAEVSGLSLGGRALKSGARGLAVSASPMLLTTARSGDPAALNATTLHTALSAPFHLIGGLARTLEDRDTARMALSRLGAAQKDQDLSDGRKLVRLKKQVAKLEGKLSDEL